jgi:hypothetical protein
MSRLMSLSSFGTPEARDERMLGRMETEKHLAQQIGRPGPLDAGGQDEQVEFAAADRLDARDYTFEAELRYRRLAAVVPLAATRLGMLLEMVGRREEAWRFYLRAAQSDEPNALLRLAVICHQRGEYQWALRLMRHAYGQLPSRARKSISDQVYRACLARPADEFGSRVIARTDRARMDAVFGLGSFFYVAADRPDLARLVYCSALGRGHSLAAVSLIDMTPRQDQFNGTGRSGYLQQFLADGLSLSRYRVYDDRWAGHDGAEIDRYPALFLSRAQTAPMNTLGTVLAGGSRESREFIEAQERVLIIARTAAMILGYRRVGTDGTRQVIRRAADKACSTLTRRIADHECVYDGSSLIRSLWQCAEDEVERIPAEADFTAQKALSRKAGGRYVPGAGVARRIGEQFKRLADDQAEVITQRVAGLYPGEVADAMKLDVDTSGHLFRTGIASLRQAHGGQQIPTSEQLLWQEVERSLGAHHDDDGAPGVAVPALEDIQIGAGLQECPSQW